MPASATAERLSGLVMHGGFRNSAPVAHPVALFLGDVIPWPGPMPNVLSIGDLIIFAGTARAAAADLRATRPDPDPPQLPPIE